MADKRTYAVKEMGAEVVALVQASNKAQALAHYARRTHTVAVAEAAELIAATKAGIDVEVAKEEESTTQSLLAAGTKSA